MIRERKNSENQEKEEIGKLADMRVSSALVINKFRQKDQMIKKVNDDIDVEGNKRKQSRLQRG